MLSIEQTINDLSRASITGENIKITSDELIGMLNKLAVYENAKAEGLLYKLPCKLGSLVWGISENAGTGRNPDWYSADECKFTLNMTDKVGKTIYLSKKEAERVRDVKNIAEYVLHTAIYNTSRKRYKDWFVPCENIVKHYYHFFNQRLSLRWIARLKEEVIKELNEFSCVERAVYDNSGDRPVFHVWLVN